MRILVGTLKTIENEYQECLSALAEQTHRDFEHFVIENQPEQKAHNLLYSRFMENAADFQLFLKLDADMVIADRNLFNQIIAKFKTRQDMDLLTILVHDFFSDRLISGLHTFRNTVTWRKQESKHRVNKPAGKPHN